jgi:hypothetical protein
MDREPEPGSIAPWAQDDHDVRGGAVQRPLHLHLDLPAGSPEEWAAASWFWTPEGQRLAQVTVGEFRTIWHAAWRAAMRQAARGHDDDPDA